MKISKNTYSPRTIYSEKTRIKKRNDNHWISHQLSAISELHGLTPLPLKVPALVTWPKYSSHPPAVSAAANTYELKWHNSYLFLPWGVFPLRGLDQSVKPLKTPDPPTNVHKNSVRSHLFSEEHIAGVQVEPEILFTAGSWSQRSRSVCQTKESYQLSSTLQLISCSRRPPIWLPAGSDIVFQKS